MTYEIKIFDNTFVLHHSGAIFWQDQKMLLIADVHLGKVAHFRKAGVPVPSDSAAKNYENLDKVCDYFCPDTVCFLGDLFHSSINNEWRLFEDWSNKCDPKVILIAGNHDIISPLKYEALGIEIYSEMEIGAFLLAHHPTHRSDFFTFCGHIHPCVRLRGKGRQFLKLPCFFKTRSQMILPAFGEFTGTYEITPVEGDCIYAVTEDAVVKVCGDD